MIFYLYSRRGTKERQKVLYDKNDIDLFLFYCVENRFCGLVKYDEVSEQESLTLTVRDKNDKSISGNVRHFLRFSCDYALEKRITEL